MNGKNEAPIFWLYLSKTVEDLIHCLDGLAVEDLNRKPIESANSLYVLATHVLGNIEQNILGILCGEAVARDREAEFTAKGDSIEPIQSKWAQLRVRIQQRLEALPPEELDRKRKHPVFGEPTGREVLIAVARHAAEHLGHAQLTRDLLLSDGR